MNRSDLIPYTQLIQLIILVALIFSGFNMRRSIDLLDMRLSSIEARTGTLTDNAMSNRIAFDGGTTTIKIAGKGDFVTGGSYDPDTNVLTLLKYGKLARWHEGDPL